LGEKSKIIQKRTIISIEESPTHNLNNMFFVEGGEMKRGRVITKDYEGEDGDVEVRRGESREEIIQKTLSLLI
jgi:hypothetical protein